MLAGNEFLTSVVDSVGWPSFTSCQLATGLGMSRRYVAQRLSRFRKDGLLIRIELARTTRAGYHRGTFNLYILTLRARSRVDWWKRRNSIFALKHLASGVGTTSELFGYAFLDDLRLQGIIQARTVKVSRRDRDGLSELLAWLDQRNLTNLCTLSFMNKPLGAVLALKKNGLIPESVLRDPATFLTVAHDCYGFSRVEIVLALLYRSLVAWKRKAESCGAGLSKLSEPASGQDGSISTNAVEERFESLAAKEQRTIERTATNVEKLSLRNSIQNTILAIEEEVLAISKEASHTMLTVNDPFLAIAKYYFSSKLFDLMVFIFLVGNRLLDGIKVDFGNDS